MDESTQKLLENAKLTPQQMETTKNVFEKAELTESILCDLEVDLAYILLKDAGLPISICIKVLEAIKNRDPDPDGLCTLSGEAATVAEKLYWVKAVIATLACVTAPVVIIGYFHESGYDANVNDRTEQWLVTFLPGVIYFIILQVILGYLAMEFSTGTTLERSHGIDHKETMEKQLTNAGVVGALIATVVVAALQADSPTDDPGSLISQWVMVNLSIALCFSVSSTILSSLCMLYMEPLSGLAYTNFVSTMALYFGEPVASMLICLFVTLQAMILWVWASYGAPIGLLITVTVSFLIIRALVSVQNMMGWKNPAIDAKTRAEREKIYPREEFDNLILRASQVSNEVQPKNPAPGVGSINVDTQEK